MTVLSPSTFGTRHQDGLRHPEGGRITYTVTLGDGGPFDQQDNPGVELDLLPSS